MNVPTVLVIACSPEDSISSPGDPLLEQVGKRSRLEEHLRALIALGCERLVVVAAPAARSVVDSVEAALPVKLRLVAQPPGGSLADAFVSAEPALSHFATGPVLVTQPHYVIETGLYGELLQAWAERSSQTDGIVATAETRKPGTERLLIEVQAGRATGCSVAQVENADSELRVYVGALAYASSRELCETIDEEAARAGQGNGVALGLHRLMAWRRFEILAYTGSWHHLGEPDGAPGEKRPTDPGPDPGPPERKPDDRRPQRPYSPR